MIRPIFLLLLFLSLPPQFAYADAIVVTQAMKASTIAEIFIEKDSLRVELEIGNEQDLKAFRNLMPDGIYEKMGYPAEPFQVRLGRFFSEDLVIRDGKGVPLGGIVKEMGPRQRVKRDKITGEPLTIQDENAPPVIFAVLEYALAEHPRQLSIKPPLGEDRFTRANIGFVVYHLGVAVNDFRYLGLEEALDLDWEDPWYSKFRNRNLWRRNASPISAFIYVEPYEVRKEIIIRPKDLQYWIDLGLKDKEVIAAGDQEEIRKKVGVFLAGRGHVTIDGQKVEPILDRIHFIRRSLKATTVVDPPEDLSIYSATLGVIYVYPRTGLPQEVTMEWKMFNAKIQQIDSSAVDEAGGMPYKLTPDDAVLRWQNFLKKPTVPSLVDLAPPAAVFRLSIPLLSLLCGLSVIVLGGLFLGRRKWPPKSVTTVCLLVIAGIFFLWPYGRVSVAHPLAKYAKISDAHSRAIMKGLLRNIYHSFDYRDENVTYDTLSKSVTGELLTDIYLETRKALELKKQGGARVKIKEVEILESDTRHLSGEIGFVSESSWRVKGTVGHWGHIHQRENQYHALLTVKSEGPVWKLTDLEMLEEKRIV